MLTTFLQRATLLCSLSAGLAQQESAPEIKEFYRLARQCKEDCTEPFHYLRRLPSPQRLAVARSVVKDPDARLAYVACGFLIRDSREDEAVPYLAAMIADGRNETQLKDRMGYDWVHSDDDTLAARLIAKIRAYLKAHATSYKGEDRRRVDQFLKIPNRP